MLDPNLLTGWKSQQGLVFRFEICALIIESILYYQCSKARDTPFLEHRRVHKVPRRRLDQLVVEMRRGPAGILHIKQLKHIQNTEYIQSVLLIVCYICKCPYILVFICKVSLSLGAGGATGREAFGVAACPPSLRAAPLSPPCGCSTSKQSQNPRIRDYRRENP